VDQPVYIEVATIIRRLSDCFDAEWMFEISEQRVLDYQVPAIGKLTAVGPRSRISATRNHAFPN